MTSRSSAFYIVYARGLDPDGVLRDLNDFLRRAKVLGAWLVSYTGDKVLLSIRSDYRDNLELFLTSNEDLTAFMRVDPRRALEMLRSSDF